MRSMSEAFVIYRGIPMTKGWPEEIAAAQSQPAVSIAEQQRPRVRYGEELCDWGAEQQPCRDCLVRKRQLHVLGCNVERCPACGGQLSSCGCVD
jgi:hypothetical protein